MVGSGVESSHPIMKKLLRLAGALLLRVLIVVALAVVAMNACFATRTADEMQSRLIAAAVAVVCIGVYYLSVKLAARPFGVLRDAIIIAAMLSVCAVAVWNMILATSRSTVKRTMADMRSLGTAIDAYSVDFNTYPQAKTLDELASVLEPVYIKQMPRKDAWRFPFRYEVQGKGKDATYYIGSSGAGGKWEKPHLADYTPHKNESAAGDIVFHNGEFVTSPMGQ